LLVEADVLKGRTVTSWPSIRTDVRNAGAHWVDEEVVTDGNLTTSRKPDDLPAFNERLTQQIGESKHTPAKEQDLVGTR
jgi:protease I